jgi:hypothetical protein
MSPGSTIAFVRGLLGKRAVVEAAADHRGALCALSAYVDGDAASPFDTQVGHAAQITAAQRACAEAVAATAHSTAMAMAERARGRARS